MFVHILCICVYMYIKCPEGSAWVEGNKEGVNAALEDEPTGNEWFGCGDPGETFGTLYTSGVGTNKTKQCHTDRLKPPNF